MSERSEYFDWPDQVAAIQSANAKLRAASDAAARARLSEPIRKLMLKAELTNADAWAALEMMRAIFWNQKDREYLDVAREALKRSIAGGPVEVHEGAAPDARIVTCGDRISEAVDMVGQVGEYLSQTTEGQTPNQGEAVAVVAAHGQANTHSGVQSKLHFHGGQLTDAVGMALSVQDLDAGAAHFGSPSESTFRVFEAHRAVPSSVDGHRMKAESVNSETRLNGHEPVPEEGAAA